MPYDLRLDMFRGGQFQSYTNSASQGRSGSRGRGNNRGGRVHGNGGHSNGGRGAGNHDGAPEQGGRRKVPCQICKRTNHEAPDCWYRYDDEDEYQHKTTGVTATGYGVDTNWYADSGASDHITSELEKMNVRDKYGGQDQVHTASRAGMTIGNIGHSVLHTPNKNLHLRNILHVPSANKSLLSVHRLASDNNAFFEFHPTFFLIKDRATKQILHQGRCERGLYPLASHPLGPSSSKQAYGVNKPSSSRWHSCLGHPAYPIVQRVLRDNNLPCISASSHESVCDSCQKAKSHQLIYSDVWGLLPFQLADIHIM
jgi:hypothetical protein